MTTDFRCRVFLSLCHYTMMEKKRQTFKQRGLNCDSQRRKQSGTSVRQTYMSHPQNKYTQTHANTTSYRLMSCEVTMLLWAVDGKTLWRGTFPHSSMHRVCWVARLLVSLAHTSLTILVAPVPVWSTNHFNPLEDSFEDDSWEVLPRCQAHPVTRAWRRSWTNNHRKCWRVLSNPKTFSKYAH